MKQTTQSTDKLTFRHFLQASKRHKEFYYIWLIPVAGVCLSTLTPYFIGKLLGALADPTANVVPAFVGLAVSGIAAIVTNRIAFANLLYLQPKVMAELQTEAVEHLMHRGTSYHNNSIGGKLVSDVLDYPQSYLRLSDAIVVQLLPFAAILVTGIVIISVNSPMIGLAVLLMAVFAIGSGFRFRKSMKPYRHLRIKAQKQLTSYVGDIITNNQTVKSFGREQFELHEHQVLNKRLQARRFHDWNMLATNGNNRIILLFVFELLFGLTLIYQIRHSPALLATGIFAFSYTVTITNRLFEIGSMLRTVEEALLMAEPMVRTLRQDLEVVDAPDAKELVVREGAVAFTNVTFHYSDDKDGEAVFSNLNLTIQPGEKVGLVGASGGGKSTLTKLLLRFEDISQGSITIDDQDISRVTQASLRSQVSYVAQEPLLFHRTVRENIAYGKLDASQEAIEAATQQAYAHEFIAKLPNQFDTVVGERGVKLSGGQRQRVAIARAILKNAPILVLDEATSALDSESEKAIQAALWELMKGKTALVIAHRLSTIQRLDRIVVLADGKIVEQGSHKELIEQDGTYAKLWAHQSGGFIDE